MRDRIILALSSAIPKSLVEELVDDFITIRFDVATSTLGRSAPGKFVETFVQILQYLETGSYDTKPNVDKFLRSIESVPSTIDDGLRICATRIARSMYTLRNKRNIAHKGEVDPNVYDLSYLQHASQWIMAELIRLISGMSMEDAGKLVQQIQTPVGTLVEDFGKRKLVLPDLSTPKEILILLQAMYPESLTLNQIESSIDRKSAKTVSQAIRRLWTKKIIEGNAKSGYCLTQLGQQDAAKVVAELLRS